MSSINELTNNQELVGTEICNLARNYRKDGPGRKTMQYLNARWAKLNELWESFDAVDSEIRDNYPQATEHEYFTKEYYDEVKKVYESTRDDIIKRFSDAESKKSDEAEEETTAVNPQPKQTIGDLETTAVNPQPKQLKGDPGPTAANPQPKQLKEDLGPTAVRPLAGPSKQHFTVTSELNTPGGLKVNPTSEANRMTMENKFRLLGKIFQASLNKCPVSLRETSPQQFHQKTKTLIINWEDITSAYKRLGDDAAVADIERYFELQDELDLRISCLPNNSLINETTSQPPQVKSTAIKLPKIEIPKFDGSYLNWPQFFDLYQQMVHNQPIAPAQKLYFLKTNVTGDAHNLIQNFHATDSNYELAWNTLVDRFNNKRLLLSAQLNRLFQHNIIADNVKSLKRLHDTTKEVIQAINNLGFDTSGWDPVVVHLLLDRMDKDTRMLFEESLQSPRSSPTLTQLLQFVECRFQALETVKPEERKKVVTTATENSREVSCQFCRSNSHKIFSCKKFISLSVEDRNQKVRKLQLCTNCLQGHHSSSCQQQSRCKKCYGRHNTLLHYPAKKDIKNTASGKCDNQIGRVGEAPSGSFVNTSLGVVLRGREVYLATAIVNILCSNGTRIPCRAMLDSGSQLNFITTSLAQQLGYPKRRKDIPISGIGGKESQANYVIDISVESRTSSFKRTIEASIMPKISDYLSAAPLNIQNWNLPSNILLADPNSINSRRIDLLIGAEIFFELILPGEFKVSSNLPLLRNTRLGWVLAGSSIDSNHNSFCHSVSKPSLSSLDKLVRSFWEIENVEGESKVYSEEEFKCEEHFNKHVERTRRGQYIVRLPFKRVPNETLGSSIEMAKKRFYSLERKLGKNLELKESYISFMEEYERLGHMTPLPEKCIPKSNYVLPHHCVFKPESSSTKLRVVFDASAKTTSGYSLNDTLMVGPTVQSDLFSIISNFRLYKYVFTGDISKMYRQILIHPNDRAYQLILWRSDPMSTLRTYQLNTVTYGTASASYLSTRCLVKLANDFQHIYPNASKIITKNIYVDDCLTGADNLDEARSLLDETIQLLREGNFDLTKFCSNDPRILENIPIENRERMLTIYQSEVIKTLGLVWDPTQDTFKFCYDYIAPTNVQVTKRSVLADLAKFFDPLGLIGPVTLLGKIFLQELWKTKIAWDENLPPQQASTWLNYLSEFSSLQEINIPRFVLIDSATKLELHAFADSSENAYGACIYFKSIDNEGKVFVQLLCSKSRVVPLKATTIARLELQAAVLLVDLVQKILPIISKKISSVSYYTDSTTVLAWIKAPSYTWETYIANRVSKIQSSSDLNHWNYVRGELNPADLISRGLGMRDLIRSSIWFDGPDFLRQTDTSSNKMEYLIPEQIPGRRKHKTVLTVSVQDDLLSSVNHKNSFFTLQKIFAYCCRFVMSFKSRCEENKRTGPLTLEDIQKGTILLWRSVQIHGFPDEYKALQAGKPLHNNSKILSLSPYFDKSTMLIHVGGRLKNAEIPSQSKNQILLPKNNIVTTLLLEHLHKKHLHVSHRTLISISRQQFWILSVGRETRKVLSKCMQCFRAKPSSIDQLMGNLPKERIVPSRPFHYSGVDFCGPIRTHYKVRGKTPTKSYLAVFVCFSTKAVHIEVVSNLTTEAFINCLKRFVGRRGVCHTIFCDNATNFVGARNQLKDFQEFLDSPETQTSINSNCLKMGINWKHIPPRSPHFGGLWEAAVKSAKILLLKYLGEASLTYEELSTVVVQIESILNSRPLTPNSSDPNDLQALTPGHFLIGAPLTSLPEPNISDHKISRLDKFRQVQHIQQHFWQRWSNEYLHLLQQKLKWKAQSQNLEPGTMVVLKDSHQPPMKWKLGRVIEVVKGTDGLVRVAHVKTDTGTYQRAIHNLCPLPIDYKGQQEEALKAPTKTQPSMRLRSGRFIGNSLVTLLCFMLLLFPLTIATDIEPIKITKFDNPTGIYFEDIGTASTVNSFWNIYIFYNLSSYWAELGEVKTYLNRMDKICLDKLKYNPYCLPTITALKHRVVIIESNNDLVHNYHTCYNKRVRIARSPFDFVGNVAHSLFGVLDQDDAKDIQQQISLVQQDEQHLVHILKKQSSIADSTVNLLKRSNLQLTEQFKGLKTMFELSLNNIERHQEKIDVSQSFSALTSYLILSITNLERVQDTLLDVLLSLNNVKMNPHFISPSQFVKQLQIIRNNIPPYLNVPTASVLDIFKLSSIKGRSLNDSIVFEMMIPLVDNQEFQLFNLVPFPLFKNDSSFIIELSSPYLAVTPTRDRYFELTENQLLSCHFLSTKNYICNQQLPTMIHRDSDKSCAVSLLNHLSSAISHCFLTKSILHDQWISLRGSNSWIFALEDVVTGLLVCEGTTKSLALSGSGLIEFLRPCTLKLPHIIINGRVLSNTTIQNSFIPSIRISEAIKTTASTKDNSVISSSGNETNYMEIQILKDKINEVAKDLDKDTWENDINTHDYHHYGISFILFIAMVGFIIFYYVKNRKPKPIPRRIAPRFEIDTEF